MNLKINLLYLLLAPEIQQMLATSIATAMVNAEKRLQPARISLGTANLVGYTHNRRANISPYVSSGTIDPNLGVIRVDLENGSPLATVWNFGKERESFEVFNE